MTTFDQAFTAGDPDAIGYTACLKGGNSTGAAAAAATLKERYPNILLPVVVLNGPGQADDTVQAGTVVAGVDGLATA